MIAVCALFQVLHLLSSSVNYGNTEPTVSLHLLRLENKRLELTYGNEILPERTGFLELVCEVNGASEDRMQTIKWHLPNQRMLQENRAFTKEEEDGTVKREYLAVTDFKKEDAGKYVCEYTPLYRKQIVIADLDGSPTLSCDLNCVRNAEDACQLLEYHLLSCISYGIPEPHIIWKFDPCAAENSCPKLTPFQNFNEMFGRNRTSNEVYKSTEKVINSGLLLQPGRYYIESKNERGTAKTTVFIPSTVGEKKSLREGRTIERVAVTIRNDKGQIVEQGVHQPTSEVRNKFIGNISPQEQKIGEEVTMACWTDEMVSDIRWFFRAAETPNLMIELENNTLIDSRITSFKTADGLLSYYIIKQFSLDHGGFYECGSVNIPESTYIAKEFAVNTLRWNEDADMKKNMEVMKRTGERFTMRCTIVTTDVPSIQWYKRNEDGTIVTIPDSNPRYEFTENRQILKMPSLRPDDTGIYICIAAAPKNLGVDDLQGLVFLSVSDSAVPEASLHTDTLIQTISGLDALQNKLTEMVDLLNNYHKQP